VEKVAMGVKETLKKVFSYLLGCIYLFLDVNQRDKVKKQKSNTIKLNVDKESKETAAFAKPIYSMCLYSYFG
jgi:hypothetical protein